MLSVLCGTVIFIIAKGLLVVQTQANCCYWWFGFALFFYGSYIIITGQTVTGCLCRENILWVSAFVLFEIVSTLLFFAGLHMIDPPTVSFLQRSQIVFVLVFGFAILGERFTAPEWGGAVIIVSGMILLTFHTSGFSLAGSLVILISTLAQSINVIIVRRIGSKNGSYAFALIRTVTLFIFYLLYAFTVPGAFGLLPWNTMLVVMAGAFFGPFLLVVSSYKSLEYLEAGTAAIFRSIQPFFVVVASLVVFGTTPGVRDLAGGILMVAGNILFISAHMKR